MTKKLGLNVEDYWLGRKLASALSLVPILGLAACSSGDAKSTSCAPAVHDAGRLTTPDTGAVSKLQQKPDSGTHVDGGRGGTGPGGNRGDGGDAGVLPAFQPSNLPTGSIAVKAGAAPAVINAECLIDTSNGNMTCPATNDRFDYSFRMIQQPGGGEAGLFVVKSLRVAQAGILHVQGGSPAVVFATDDIVIDGSVTGVSNGQPAGGFPQDATGHGGGPGGGEALLDYAAGGGGSYCGLGGKGGVGISGTARAGGPIYGNPEIVPLIGGSSGGGGANVNTSGGTGGAALQLSAGSSITVSPSGVINVGGRGGNANGGGAGSGGSLLLEAPNVGVHGTLAANGGGGAIFNGGSAGQIGQPSSTAALGNADTAGTGSAGSSKDGGDGSATAGSSNSAGGGGGGAGRIRINTATGMADLTSATISPDASTGCTTEGKLN